jgi:hypothetical protein
VLSLIVSIVFPILCVYSILSFFLLKQSPRNYGTILNISLSVGLVLGISSCTFFLWLYFLGFPSTNYHVIENILAVILIPIAFYTSKYHLPMNCSPVKAWIRCWQGFATVHFLMIIYLFDIMQYNIAGHLLQYFLH